MLATLAAYQPVWHGGVLWDDAAHITQPGLRSIGGLWRIWFEVGATQQYYPLVHSAFWVMHRLWGDQTLGYHLVNIFLHALSACLFALILRRLHVAGAIFAAVIFALHPVHVESVAWMTELKNTLSGTLYLAAAMAYLDFDDSRRRRGYVLALVLFSLALLSKSVVATLPAALLVVFWWRRGRLRWRADVLPLAPFFAIGVAGGLTTVWVERTIVGAEGTMFQLTLIERCLIAGRAIWFYLATLAWPVNLMFIYPRWDIDQRLWWQYLYPLGVVALVTALWLLRKRSRAPLAAVLVFCGTLVPALGFFNVFPFQFSFVADHFQYQASLPIIALVAGGLATLVARWRPQSSMVEATVLLGLAAPLAALTFSLSHQYADVDTLYRVTISRNPACWMCENNLGGLQLARSSGVSEETIAHFTHALELSPDYAFAHNNLGVAWRRKGLTDQAMNEFREAVRLQPGFFEAHYNLGIELQRLGKYDEAIQQFRFYVHFRPDEASKMSADNMIGRTLATQGRFDEAAGLFRQLLSTRPDNPEARSGLADVLLRQGRHDEAVREYREYLRLVPDNASAHHSLGLALVAGDREEEAIEPFSRAVALQPQSAPYRQDLGNALAATGRIDEAIASYEQGLALAPTNVGIHNALGIAFAARGRTQEALAQFQRSLEIQPDNAQTRRDRETAMRLAARNAR